MDKHQNQQQLVLSSSDYNLRGKQDYFKSITQSLDSEFIDIASPIYQEATDAIIKKIVKKEIKINKYRQPIEEFIKKEKLYYKKLEIDRMKAKESVFIDKQLEQKLLSSQVEIHMPTDGYQDDDKNKKWEDPEELAERQREAQKLILKINAERKERQKRFEELQKLEQEKHKKEHEERDKRMEKERQDKELDVERRRIYLEKQLQERADERMKHALFIKEHQRQVQSKTRLYQELEKRYNEEELRLKEVQKMQRLSDLKSHLKPLTKEELDEHSRKYDELMRQKKEELRRKRGDLDISRNYESSDNGVNHQNSSVRVSYKSQIHDKLLRENRDFKDKFLIEKQQKKDMIKRMNQYAKQIKEIYRSESEMGAKGGRHSESMDMMNPKYSSPFRDRFLKEEREMREVTEKEKMEKKKIHERINSYYKYVKDTIWQEEERRKTLDSVKDKRQKPLKSIEEKHENLSDTMGSKKKLNRNNTQEKLNVGEKRIRSKEKRKQKDKDGKYRYDSEPDLQASDGEVQITNERQKKLKRPPQLLKPTNASQSLIASKDSISANSRQNQRNVQGDQNSKKELNADLKKVQSQELDKILNDPNLSEKEKQQMLKIETERIQKKMELEQKQDQLLKQLENKLNDKNFLVNEMYIDTIKAKLRMIDKT